MLGISVPRLAAVTVSLALAGLGPQAQAADPAAGKSVFSSTCSICHAVQPGKNMVGPESRSAWLAARPARYRVSTIPRPTRTRISPGMRATLDKDPNPRAPRSLGTIMTYGGTEG